MKIKPSFSYLFIIISFLIISCNKPPQTFLPVQYIDPFIGTDGHGHTYPGATTPFGMVQLSPQTRLDGWDGCSGYHYTDSIIYGFAHTALSGTGVSDYGDILLMPFVGEPVFSQLEYRSPFRKENEYAEAGYYRVFLDKPSVLAEMTTSTRVGYHRYTFPESDEANIIIDLKHRDHVVESWIEFVSDTEIRGMRRSSNWANDMVWFFHMQFSKPFDNFGIELNNELSEGLLSAHGNNIKAYVGFSTASDEIIEVKVGLSAVDVDGAHRNLQSEIGGWDFDRSRYHAFIGWNEAVSKITVHGGTTEQKRVFYTALYHAMLQPNTFIDIDGRYRGMDHRIHITTDYNYYTVFSLWDTYRAWHPLMTIIEQERSMDFIRTMLDMYDKGGLLPIWELAANETYCMIGNHGISVIADAWMKGLRDYDGVYALNAMVHSATRDHFGLDYYQKFGYIPGDKEHESISKTLEYAYNDWCIALMANDLGLNDVYIEYLKRAQGYKHIFDPQTGFMRPRLNGNWLTPFDPTRIDWHFTEANAWQYSFYVPQDITGFIELHGGKENLALKIDELFHTEAPISGRDMKDISGLIGQYAHGNEPSHHMAYLYNYVDQPWKTQVRVRQIMDKQYSDKPDGLSGNEDCGQMSAWLIMSAMGFYPVSPGLPEYAIGTPWFPEMDIFLENGNIFKITASNLSEDNYYIQTAKLNGEHYSKSYLTHADIISGGHLHFEMGNKPNSNWGTGVGHAPQTHINKELIVPVPVVESEDVRIKEQMEVKLKSIMPGSSIYYTLDGSVPDLGSNIYTEPVYLSDATTLMARSWHEDYGFSNTVEAQFIKIDLDRSITIKPPLNPSYHAGGPEALIDGLRGMDNFRLGNWQGYQGVDFEAIVDLGTVKQINYLAAGFLQEIRSWIWMPVDVIFSVSNDGIYYHQVARIENPVPVDNYEVIQLDLGTELNEKARYVKVMATSFGTIPDWHLGAGGQAWIFIDEIIIR